MCSRDIFNLSRGAEFRILFWPYKLQVLSTITWHKDFILAVQPAQTLAGVKYVESPESSINSPRKIPLKCVCKDMNTSVKSREIRRDRYPLVFPWEKDKGKKLHSHSSIIPERPPTSFIRGSNIPHHQTPKSSNSHWTRQTPHKTPRPQAR